jgi:hypothetical protein
MTNYLLAQVQLKYNYLTRSRSAVLSSNHLATSGYRLPAARMAWLSAASNLASAVGRLPSLRSGVNGQARRLAGTVAVQGS